MCWGPVPETSAELDVSPVADLAMLLEALREEPVDLVVLSDARVPLLDSALLMVEADPGLPLLVARDAIGAKDRELLHTRLPLFSCEARELSVGLISAVAHRAFMLRSMERRSNATEAALRAARRWREETEGRLRDLFHELRTPVAVALGWCSNIADGIEGPIEARQKAALGRAKNALETMGQLLESGPAMPEMSEAVGALLDLERAREQRRRRLRLDQLAGEILGMMELEAVRKKIRLESSAEAELPPIWGERVRLAQLLLNLVGNALRHARTKVSVRVERVRGPNHDRILQVSVEDDGPGFAGALLERAFERGTSGDGRSGLGLSIVKEITREHGGECSAHNQDRGGARLEVRLPTDPRTRARPAIDVLALEDELLFGPLVDGLAESETTRLRAAAELPEILESLRRAGGVVLLSEPAGRQIEAALARVRTKSGGAS